ncbi:uncharacterized protein LOC133900240 [Phragmites australis]|uniref:uncharacterized protein LOC133900240 n=1 Tax=Phragmites australis TaxID=29695 RepID=UPI002D77F2AE|nr:uncharacterized protein LOC133900240 [Phragmites australis]
MEGRGTRQRRSPVLNRPNAAKRHLQQQQQQQEADFHDKKVIASTYFSIEAFLVLACLAVSLLILPLVLPPLPPPPSLLLWLPVYSLDECLWLGESTIIESMRQFVRAVVEVFGDEYPRAPNEEDTAHLFDMNQRRGFLGMLGSIDCMHWRWKKCPTAWSGSFTSHVNAPTIILEAVASQDLWIWHAFFGIPGSLNNINVLHRSHLLDNLAASEAPKVQYSINGHHYTMGYYLADGIYPKWATFVKPIQSPIGRKWQHFVVQQAVARKDVKRVFGVLQARFPIVRGAARFWDQETRNDIMTACIVMHNMIIEDERPEGEVKHVYEGAGKLESQT